MKQLNALLADASSRATIVADCVDVVDTEVRSKKGISGIAVKTAYGVVKAIKPGIIPETLDGLVEEFIGELQPHYESYQQEGCPGTLQNYLTGKADQVAESMLAVTDRRADKARNRTLVKAYHKLRPKGKEHVVVAVPRVGAVLDKHAPNL